MTFGKDSISFTKQRRRFINSDHQP